MLRRQSPVARFVVIVLLILAALLSAALGTIDHLSERARLQAELQLSARVQADQLAASLALPVWNFDQSQIEKIADSVLHDREAAGIIVHVNDLSSPTGFRTFGRLRDDAGTTRDTDADLAAPAGQIVEQRPLDANGESVGSFSVFYTPLYVNAELRNHLVSQILTFIAFGIILAAGLYLLLWRTVLRPLHLLEQYAGGVSTGAPAPPIRRAFRGELDRLRDSIEKMVRLLAARYDSLQQNQAMLSVILNSTPQSIFWKDLDSRYLGCNEPFAKLAGLATPEAIIGKSDYDLPWPREATDLYRANDFQVICTGIPKGHIVEPLHTANGQDLHVETTKVPLRDAGGKIYGVLGVFEDITERIANEQLIASQLHFEELVARISSELVVAQPDNLQPILTRALGDIARMLDADRVILGRTDETSGDLVSRASFCPGGPPVPERLALATHYPDLWQRLLQGLTIHVPCVADLAPESIDRVRFDGLGIQSQLAAPVVIDGRLEYVLSAATIGRRAAWSDTAAARIKVLAGLLATTALRCEAEEVVRASERQFRTFIEQAPVPILLVPSPDGAPVYFNPAFTRTFGYTRADMKRPEDWWPLIYPDPAYRAQRHAAWEQIIVRARETGGFQDAEEAEMQTKSGEKRFAQVRLTLVGGYRMSFLNDLTDRRHAETALRLTQHAVDNNPVMIFRIDMEGRFVYANDAACARFGYSPAEILQLHIWDIAQTVTADDWGARRDMLRDSRSSNLESVYTTRHGDTFPVEVRIQYVNFSGIQHFFSYANDITDRKAAQEAEHAYTRRIQKLATELTHAEERQRRELAAILHDSVGQNLFAATTQLLTARSRAGEAQPEVERAISLLDQVTRDTRQLTFELCPPVLYQLGLVPALQRLADQFAARFHIPCTVTGTTHGPEDLNARGLAYQAIRELLNNIAKHANAKHVKISATEDDSQVTLAISDDGAGFDPARLSPSTTAASSGFGLYHLRERLQLLGGNLTIDSAPGQGTRVQFTLPLNALALAS